MNDVEHEPAACCTGRLLTLFDPALPPGTVRADSPVHVIHRPETRRGMARTGVNSQGGRPIGLPPERFT